MNYVKTGVKTNDEFPTRIKSCMDAKKPIYLTDGRLCDILTTILEIIIITLSSIKIYNLLSRKIILFYRAFVLFDI